MVDLFQAMNEPDGRVLRIEADGGSRGNPGPAAYGTVVMDQKSRSVLVEDAGFVGKTTNNVAEYHGLIAGLKITRALDPQAEVKVFLDSKLVVEQMSGRWKIKHEAMKELAAQARELALGRTISYQWIPREENSHADRLANEAMDAHARGETWKSSTTVEAAAMPDASQDVLSASQGESSVVPAAEASASEWEPAHATEYKESKPWSMRAPFSGAHPTTTLILVRHGRTEHTLDKRMSGSAGSDPSLSAAGRDDAIRVAQEIAKMGVSGAWAHLPKPTRIVASPMNRAKETAEAISAEIKVPVELDDAWVEASFGVWEGKTLAEVAQEDPEALKQWEGSVTFAPPEGESLVEFTARSRRAHQALVEKYAGEAIVSVSHATPVRCAVIDAVGATDEALWKLLISPASISIVRFWADETSDVLTINSCSHLG